MGALWAAFWLGHPSETQGAGLSWKSAQQQKPEWYATAEAVRVADNVLLHQRNSRGWPKNIEMAVVLDESARARLIAAKAKNDSTIDNGATCSQLRYLARVYRATRMTRFQEAFLGGLDYLLQAQYPNGGWPQYYPKPTGYHAHITFNDNAMVNVLRLLQAVSQGEEPYDFVEATWKTRCREAVAKGVDCILKCQVVVDGRPTVWCAQHDARTLQPAGARSYEHPSLSGGESVGIVRFLMELDRPNPETINAIQSAVAWFDQVKLRGIRQVRKPDPSLPKGYDKVIVPDETAPPLWGRFHEIGSNRPIFSGRDGVVRYRLDQIEHERRVGYSWYISDPERLLEKEYPEWKKRWITRRENLLMDSGGSEDNP